MRSLLYSLVLVLISSTFIDAQTMLTNTPNVSQKAWVGQRIGLTDITLKYHRPAVKERALLGNLIAYNQVWRAGANDNTLVSFSKDVKIQGQDLKAGKYGFHIFVAEDGAQVIFSNNATSWGSYSYNPAEDALKVAIPLQKSDKFYEFLTFEFEDIQAESAVCALYWGKEKFAFKIETEVHNAVLANLKNELRNKAGWTWQGWNEAANYCLKNNVNIQEGLGWATRSVFMTPNAGNMLTKAKLVAKSKAPETTEKENELVLAALGDDLEKLNVTWKEYNGAANYATKLKDWNKALAWADKSIDMSRNMTTLMAKVKILDQKGNTKEASKLKKEALARGTNAELNLYAYQLMWSGKTAEAVEIFEANAEKNPEDPNVWDSLGEGYIGNNQKEKAIKALKKSLSMNPPAGVKANSIKLLKQLGIDYNKKAQP